MKVVGISQPTMFRIAVKTELLSCKLSVIYYVLKLYLLLMLCIAVIYYRIVEC